MRRTYFEQQRLGKEGDVTLSKELFCRLIRNTMTNMVSIARASSDDYKYPTKHEVIAMAKRLVEYYPMIKDKSTGSRHEWVSDIIYLIIEKKKHCFVANIVSKILIVAFILLYRTLLLKSSWSDFQISEVPWRPNSLLSKEHVRTKNLPLLWQVTMMLIPVLQQSFCHRLQVQAPHGKKMTALMKHVSTLKFTLK